MDWLSYILGLLTIPAVVLALATAYILNELALERGRRGLEPAQGSPEVDFGVSPGPEPGA